MNKKFSILAGSMVLAISSMLAFGQNTTATKTTVVTNPVNHFMIFVLARCDAKDIVAFHPYHHLTATLRTIAMPVGETVTTSNLQGTSIRWDAT